MIVIGRSLHEAVQIGNNVTVKVLRIAPNRVTLGIDAPKAVPLQRGRTETRIDRALGDSFGGHLNVLVVENTPIHAWLIEKSFNAYGCFQTQIATTAHEALGRLGLIDGGLNPEPVHLILLELELPDMPGLELLRKIRGVDSLRTTPTVVFSTTDSESDMARCLEAGANAFLSKPETEEGFRQMIFRTADFWSHACGLPVRVGASPEASIKMAESLAC